MGYLINIVYVVVGYLLPVGNALHSLRLHSRNFYYRLSGEDANDQPYRLPNEISGFRSGRRIS